jgi:ADP-ribose pyrophosphatase
VTDKPLDEIVTSSKRIYNGKIINLRVDTIVLPNGKPSQREIVEHRGAVAMVPLRANGNTILVRQWRTPAHAALLEIPAGTLEPGEDPQDAAYRELTEEINLAAGRMTKLFESYMAPGYTTELIRYYLAQDLTDSPGHADDDEFLEIIEVPLEEAVGKIVSGEICDAKSISGLLFVDRLRREGQLG